MVEVARILHQTIKVIAIPSYLAFIHAVYLLTTYSKIVYHAFTTLTYIMWFYLHMTVLICPPSIVLFKMHIMHHSIPSFICEHH